jgi:UDP-N-acetyl-2-amino-2-deoxyglucuronate dehydrogenase
MDKRLGFGLVGCGFVARKHASALMNGVPGARLVAACDPSAARATQFANEFGVPTFSDVHAMMETFDAETSIISVLTPTGRHAQDVREILRYEKHVVVEKPMALTVADAVSMVHSCETVGVKLFVVKQNRYNVPVRKLYEAIKSGRTGKIVLATARVRWRRDQAYFDRDDWRGTRQWDGGVFANQASHHVDLLSWLAGDIESVFAYTKPGLLKIETEDTGVAALRFTSGALGMLEATTAARPRDLEGSISILAERSSVEIGGFAADRLKTWEFIEPLTSDAEVRERFAENPQPGNFAYNFSRYLNDVVQSVREGTQPVVDGREGLKTMRIIEAIYRSARTGRETRVSDTLQQVLDVCPSPLAARVPGESPSPELAVAGSIGPVR